MLYVVYKIVDRTEVIPVFFCLFVLCLSYSDIQSTCDQNQVHSIIFWYCFRISNIKTLFQSQNINRFFYFFSYKVVVMVRTPTKAEEVAISSASAGITPSSSSPQFRPLTALSFRSMWTDSGFRPTTNVIVSPAAAMSGTVKQQSKSYVLVSLT